jgi:hypothetical protein
MDRVQGAFCGKKETQGRSRARGGQQDEGESSTVDTKEIANRLSNQGPGNSIGIAV